MYVDSFVHQAFEASFCEIGSYDMAVGQNPNRTPSEHPKPH